MKPNDGAGHQNAIFEDIRSAKLNAAHESLPATFRLTRPHGETSYRLGKALPNPEAAERMNDNHSSARALRG